MSACEKADRWQVALELFQAVCFFAGEWWEMLDSCIRVGKWWEIDREFVVDGIIMENFWKFMLNGSYFNKEDSVLNESRYENSPR